MQDAFKREYYEEQKKKIAIYKQKKKETEELLHVTNVSTLDQLRDKSEVYVRDSRARKKLNKNLNRGIKRRV